jgi:hypothetical protein
MGTFQLQLEGIFSSYPFFFSLLKKCVRGDEVDLVIPLFLKKRRENKDRNHIISNHTYSTDEGNFQFRIQTEKSYHTIRVYDNWVS